MSYDVKDLSLAPEGKKRIEWAGAQMPVLAGIRQRFQRQKTFEGIILGACLHVTSETANLMLTLKAGGARVALCASNPLSTQDAVAASLFKDYGISVFAIKGEDQKTYYRHISQVLKFHPQITMDDGADLVAALHKRKIKNAKGKVTIQSSKLETWQFYGSSEETTTGVVRLRAMEKDKALKVPVIAANDSDTKHQFDNRYGIGQSTIDGIMRTTNVLLAGKTFVVVGYGFGGKGLTSRAWGMGAHVVVVEVDPIKALEAALDGFRVMTINEAAKIGDIFVTVTGNKKVLPVVAIKLMKDGAILANAGHFNVEIDVAGLEKIKQSKRTVRLFVEEYKLKNGKKIYLLGEGRLINLVGAEGHPAEVMDMSFANQALAAEYLMKNKGKLEVKVHVLPKELDQMVARLKLRAMGMGLETMTVEQKRYLSSWQEGT
ncbi:MAG: adenosylhomocysteinase [Candidatus Chisholmbacteria bacterium]|nr:adenosylhomocysteinase [Candidatus Chisholmbacteria bacterium]